MISIIIPYYNRAVSLQKTLTSIYNQVGWTDFEVIVVDNGSTDATALICRQFENANPGLKYFYDAVPGLLTGRHFGASVAKGDILCFIDDDVELCASWLPGVKDAFKQEDIHLATGPSLPKYQVNPPKWLNYFWDGKQDEKFCSWLSLLDFGKEIKIIHPCYVFGLNFCIRKETLFSLGGFHPDCIPADFQMFQGDGETGLSMKAFEKCYKVIYHPGIQLYHLISKERLTINYFEKRAFYQGVCNSFTYLRNKYFTENEKIISTAQRFSFFRKVYRRLKSVWKQINYPESNEIKALKQRFAEKEKEGYQFHQKAFQNDEKVQQWVLKKDYWDYTLPS